MTSATIAPAKRNDPVDQMRFTRETLTAHQRAVGGAAMCNLPTYIDAMQSLYGLNPSNIKTLVRCGHISCWDNRVAIADYEHGGLNYKAIQ